MKIFKIRNSEGLWSSGGAYPRFSKKGKAWSNIGFVKNHLSMFEIIPSDWEVVEFELTENEKGSIKAYKLNPKAISSDAAIVKDIL